MLNRSRCRMGGWLGWVHSKFGPVALRYANRHTDRQTNIQTNRKQTNTHTHTLIEIHRTADVGEGMTSLDSFIEWCNRCVCTLQTAAPMLTTSSTLSIKTAAEPSASRLITNRLSMNLPSRQIATLPLAAYPRQADFPAAMPRRTSHNSNTGFSLPPCVTYQRPLLLPRD